MIRSNSFEKKYTLLVPFIKDINVRNNMLSNRDLYDKYLRNQSLIKAYVNELKNRFDIETIESLIKETIFKLPEELLRSFITAYLNSSEATKNHPDALVYYKKSLSYGNESVKFIEENGIITNREYKNLPKIIIDKKFTDLITKGIYKYNGENILLYENSLTLQEKSLLNTFIESRNLEVLDEVFRDYMDLKKALAYLNATGINTNIINKKNLEFFGSRNLLFISMINFSMLGDNNLKNNIDTIKIMIDNKRIDLINVLVENNLLYFSYIINNDSIDTISVEDMLNQIMSKRHILEKVA